MFKILEIIDYGNSSPHLSSVLTTFPYFTAKLYKKPSIRYPRDMIMYVEFSKYSQISNSGLTPRRPLFPSVRLPRESIYPRLTVIARLAFWAQTSIYHTHKLHLVTSKKTRGMATIFTLMTITISLMSYRYTEMVTHRLKTISVSLV